MYLISTGQKTGNYSCRFWEFIIVVTQNILHMQEMARDAAQGLALDGVKVHIAQEGRPPAMRRSDAQRAPTVA